MVPHDFKKIVVHVSLTPSLLHDQMNYEHVNVLASNMLLMCYDLSSYDMSCLLLKPAICVTIDRSSIDFAHAVHPNYL